MPKPIRELSAHCLPRGACPLQEGRRCVVLEPYTRCPVLWECSEALSPQVLARTIIEEGMGGGLYDSPLSMPAPTYLAGRSTSSFALAWKLVEDGIFPEWSSVICSCQTEGRGQLRRQWHSPRGNLHVSFRLPAHPAFQGDAASLVTGYLMVRAFRFLGFPVFLKWPNDILLGEAGKVGGILLEEKDGVVLAGLGVNISEAPAEDALRQGHATPATVLLPHHASMGEFAARGWREQHAPRGREDLPLAPFSLWKQLVTGAILEYSHSVARQGLPYVLDCVNGNGGICPPAEPIRPDHAGPDASAGRAQNPAAGPHPDSLPASLLAWKDKRVIVSDGDGVRGRLLGVGSGGGLLLSLASGARREIFSGSLSLDE